MAELVERVLHDLKVMGSILLGPILIDSKIIGVFIQIFYIRSVIVP